MKTIKDALKELHCIDTYMTRLYGVMVDGETFYFHTEWDRNGFLNALNSGCYCTVRDRAVTFEVILR